MKRLLIAAVALAILAAPSLAEEKTEPTELLLSTAAETKPALKYRLLPHYLDQRPGNAVPFYMRAFLAYADRPLDAETQKKIADWLQTPLEELPLAEVRRVLDKHAVELGEVRLATLRTRCEWDAAVRERGADVFAVILPDVQSFRTFGRLLALEARLHIAQGDHEQAIASLQAGLAMSRHVGEQPFLVSGLVAVAISQIMTEQLETLISAEDAPNLYWSIAALPAPFIDWRRHLEMEASVLFIMYPELQEIEKKELTAHQWRQLWRKLFTQMAEMFEGEMEFPGGSGEQVRRLAAIAFADMLVEKRYPRARKALIQRGHKEEDVDAMGKAQVTLLDELHTIRVTFDDVMKWSHVPYWQARDGIAQVEAAMQARRGEGGIKAMETLSLADLLVPSLQAAISGYHRVNHRLAALQTIEALRLHAARHDGRLPMTLNAVDLPLPLNPYTGQPAEYELDTAGSTATLTLPSPRKDRTLIYQLRVRK